MAQGWSGVRGGTGELAGLVEWAGGYEAVGLIDLAGWIGGDGVELAGLVAKVVLLGGWVGGEAIELVA